MLYLAFHTAAALGATETGYGFRFWCLLNKHWLRLLLLLQWTPAAAAAAMETGFGLCFCHLLNGRWFAAVAPIMDTYCGYSDKRRLWLLMLS
ncbi:hypothetical protein V502_01678 [Pseudogymnoascus sp. VKM F-4520 (FW-2644)]|nr:hypothetical protein V502_01678 [Pseudogymnoascus sp. VKM F-4520 (FW-2644)]